MRFPARPVFVAPSFGLSLSAAGAFFSPVTILQGITTVNSLPSPSVLFTVMVPFIMSTRLLVMAMPSPVPWMPLMVVLRSRVKASKIVFWNSGFMPMPLSQMVNTAFVMPSDSVSSSFTVKQIFPPSGVYFTALERMFSRMRLSRSLSAITSSWGRVSTSTVNSCPLAPASSLTMVDRSSITFGRCTSSSSITVAPLSMRLISSTSLISESRCWPDTDILSR